MTFGERLKTLRQELGYSQVELAKLSKVPVTSISHFESGRRSPSLEVLIRMVKVLNNNANFLLGLNDAVDTQFETIGLNYANGPMIGKGIVIRVCKTCGTMKYTGEIE